MTELADLDSLVIDLIVDNLTDSYSTKPSFVVDEFTNVINAGAADISGKTLCCAQLGFSIVLTGIVGKTKHKMIFDAGPEGAIYVRNAKNMGVELDDVEEIAVSHGHWDHMGALLAALDNVTDSGRRRVPCHVNPGMFVERGARLRDGRVVPFQKVPSPEVLSEHGAEVVNSSDERFLLDDFFYLSGEIPRVTDFEKGRLDHLARTSTKAEWEPDPLLMDERFLAANIAGKGLIVFSSCSHAGAINVLLAAQKRFPTVPLYCIFGGLHLVGALEKIIPATIEHLKSFDLKQIIPCHCTGFRAHNALLNEFGETVVVPGTVGSRYSFDR